MLFNSITFFLFLGVVLLAFYVMPKNWKKYFLLFASYVFYGFWDWRFCLLILGSTLLDFIIGQKMDAARNDKQRKQLLYVSIFGNLTVLFFFKYFNFFASSVVEFFHQLGWQTSFVELHLILPVGISFYTFQTLSYSIDIYRKKLKPAASFTDFALFVAFFPQLVAGPIERARSLLPQLAKLNMPTAIQFKEGLVYITFGLTLKMILADNAGQVVNLVFENPAQYSTSELLIAPFLFLIQVYGDFAGYSLVAQGVAKLFGVELMVNFRQPLLSTNYTDFWRRWHISLYEWFREYLYFPLGGSKKGVFRTYLNVMIIMTLLGLWHGASWNFVVWGFLNGLILVLDKIWSDNIILRKQVSPKFNFLQFPKIFLTVFTFSATLIVFRTYEIQQTYIYFQQLFLFHDFSIRLRVGVTAFFIISLVYLIDILYEKHDGNAAFLLKIEPVTRYAILTAIWMVLISILLALKPVTYYYYQF
jgi:alginate O-acetyltransferase complex protein AlgI